MTLSIRSLSVSEKLCEIFGRDTAKLVTELGEIARVGGLEWRAKNPHTIGEIGTFKRNFII